MWKLKIAEGKGPRLTSTNNHIGRQYWEFDPEAGTSEERAEVQRMQQEFKKNRFQRKQSADLLMRMQLKKENSHCPLVPQPIKVKEIEDITDEAVTTTLRRAINFYSTIQAHDGHWPAEFAGPLFFSPLLVMALYITRTLDAVLSLEHRKEIIRYIYNHQNEDGGWGTHTEGHSTILGSVFCYIALRLLGEAPDDGEDMARGRRWILDHGGAVATPTWGKFCLAVLGVYDWEGCNPMPPEFCLLPKLFPIHPAKMTCHGRSIYVPLSYLYGKRFVGPKTELIHTLREELYTKPYPQINWNVARNTIAKEDLYSAHHLILDTLWGFLYHFAEPILMRWPFSTLRKKALEKALEHVHYEDENSRYLGIVCLGKVLSMLACWAEDPNSEAFKCHLARIPDYFWIAEDGLKVQCSGAQTWDAAFAIQAILCSNLVKEYGATLKKSHNFIKTSQVKDNPSGNFSEMHRHISKGAWTLSAKDQGWQVSDCVAEGLKVSLLLAQMSSELAGDKIETRRLYDAVNVILSMQSKNGGFPAWEPRRAYSWIEVFNPIEFLEGVLIEQEYVECTSSAIQALALFHKLYPGHRKVEIESCISKAIKFIENEQGHDGSWYGCWGICYTYATWFAVEGLVACGKNYKNSPVLRKACKFLLSKQLADGGWGESYLSCSNKTYTNLDGNCSNLVQTSWALLSLIAAGQAEIDPTPIHRGIRLLVNSQMDDGDFPQQEFTGVFMRNCPLNYSSYRNIFPVWALGRYHQLVLLA